MTTTLSGETAPRRGGGFGRRFRAVAMALAAALALPALPLLASTAAHAADTAAITFSNVAVTDGSRPLDADGFLAASNTLVVNEWNPGTVSGSAGQYVMFGFDVAIADGAQPGQTFSITLPENWAYRTGGDPAPLADANGTLATGKIANVNGIRTLTYTLTDYVVGRIDMQATAQIQVQELSSPDRAVGDHVGTVTDGNGSTLAELKVRIPEPIWYTPALSMSWSGNSTTPTGGVELRSWPSFDGSSGVTATVYAGAGYKFNCDDLRNQDPSKRVGIGLVDIGDKRNSLPTSEWLLDPSKYTLTCDGGSFTIDMPASSWTSADAQTGQVLRVLTTRIVTDDSWQADGAVFAYADLEQNGRVLPLDGRAAPGGSSGSGSSNQLPPGAFETLMFQDMNGNSAYDDGVDVVLPGINVKITGTTTTGTAVDTTVTTDDQGRARATLREGDYTATILNPPAGMTQVTPNVGDDEFDSDFDASLATFTVKSRTTVARDGGFFVPMGTFSIEKKLTGDAASWIDPATTFTIDYTYEAGTAYPAGSGTVVIAADGVAVTSPAIPVGAKVTLSEQNPAPVEGAQWGAAEFSATELTIPSGTTLEEVTVTNPISATFGTFSARKDVTGEAAGLLAPDATFDVTYSWTATAHFPAGSGEMTLQADGTPVTSVDIPHGSVVTVEEKSPTAIDNTVWVAPTYSSETFTIVGGQSAGEVLVTNELNLAYGSFTVAKALTGDAASWIAPDTEFTIDYTYPAGAGFAAGSGQIVILADGVPVSSPLIPAGAVVSLIEVAPAAVEGAEWGAAEFSADSVTIATGEPVAVTVTNPINPTWGTFTVTKALAGPAASLVPADTSFHVTYTWDETEHFPAGAGELSVLADGTTVTSAPIPHGAVVTVQEETPAAITGTVWADPTYSTQTLTIVGNESAGDVVITNSLDLAYGSFTVAKALTGDAATWVPAGTGFTVEYSYPPGAGFAAGAGELVILADGTPVSSPQIPVGAVVSLSETAPEAIEGAEWSTPSFSADQVTVVAGEPTAITVTNPINPTWGTFSVVKKVAGDAADRVADSTSFHVNYSWTATEHYEAGNGELSVLADGTPVVSAPIPHGAVVTIEEVTPAEVSGATWEAPVYSAQDLKIIGNESAGVVTITNTLTAVTPPPPTPTPTPTPTPVPTPPATPTPTPTVTPTLPATGAADATGGAILGMIMLAGAGALFLIRRRSVNN